MKTITEALRRRHLHDDHVRRSEAKAWTDGSGADDVDIGGDEGSVRVVISFSHFLPTPRLFPGFSGLLSVMGCSEIQSQVPNRVVVRDHWELIQMVLTHLPPFCPLPGPHAP